MNYVIIGNSAAAVGCVEGIRSVDKTGGITIVSDEPHHTYSRPLISYLIYGKTDEQKMKYRPDCFYSDNGVTTLLGKKALSIDKDKMTVSLDDGSTVPYDKLLVATGSSPFVPPMEGLDSVKDKFSFMKLDDARALKKVLSKDKRVLIVGAGLIGLKCAEGICAKVGKITVVDLAGRILPSILDEEGSEIVKAHIEEKGVEFILGDSVKLFSENSALLNGGKTVDFDILVVAVGVRPNVSLIKEIGGGICRGICTNNKCETTVSDIYAAGDCTESLDITTGATKIMALLPNAYMQGECAGINMAGGEKLYDKAIPMNAIGFFGLHVITAGSYTGEAYTDKAPGRYKKLFVKDNLLKGYILIGEVKRAGIYTALIKERTPLDTVDFDLIKDKPQLMAFSKTERKRVLGK